MTDEKTLVWLFLVIGVIALIINSYYTYKLESNLQRFLESFSEGYVAEWICQKENGTYVLFDDSVFVVCNHVNSLDKIDDKELCDEFTNDTKRNACYDIFENVFSAIERQCYNVTHVEELVNQTGLGVLDLIDKGYLPREINFDRERYSKDCEILLEK